ncbi:glycoside hydrolase family 73 protein [Algivirga pacifica]|uniref:Mannosyl-glycoprotein endo-beta-N-acetylglucosamidase-like domain-containing protein n=1 Tax=Algivirga pacifica TaxID=1162670 RepID=A0ABP9DKN8_9BACT
MRSVHFILPVSYKSNVICCGYTRGGFYLSFREKIYRLEFTQRSALILGAFVLTAACFHALLDTSEPSTTLQSSVHAATPPDYTINRNDVIGSMMEDFIALEEASLKHKNADIRESFTIKKQLILSRYLIQAKVNRPDQLSDESLLSLNQEVSDLFLELVVPSLNLPNHVHRFFTAEKPLRKLETALMEQAKYHVPASIKLAQAALETGYGQRVINNNYFGIKDKSGRNSPSITTEYYTHTEYKFNQHKVISHEKVQKGGRTLYKCIVKDSFQHYTTPWESFRGHSIFLSQNKRYSPLFTKGRNYKAWADKIGSTKYGGVGYATSPIYGELLKKIIQRYHLDLLDY